MPKLIRTRERLLAATVSVMALAVLTGPALANSFLQDIPFDLGSWGYTGLVQQAQADLRRVITSKIQEAIDPDLAPILQSAIERAIGAQGVLDPSELAKRIEQELSTLPQTDITEPVPSSKAVERQANSLVVEQQIEAVLGQAGQERTQQKAELSTAAVEQSRQLANTAQAAVSTQEAIKAMALQQANSSDLLGAMHQELLQSRQDSAVQSLSLNDIAETLDQERTARQAERRGDAITGLEQAAAARLF